METDGKQKKPMHERFERKTKMNQPQMANYYSKTKGKCLIIPCILWMTKHRINISAIKNETLTK